MALIPADAQLQQRFELRLSVKGIAHASAIPLLGERLVLQVRASYHHRIETRGPKKIQAVCALMRKLLLAFHGLVKARQPFDSARFYARAPAAA